MKTSHDQAKVMIVDLALEQVTSHDHPLDLVGAFIDLGVLGSYAGHPATVPSVDILSC